MRCSVGELQHLYLELIALLDYEENYCSSYHQMIQIQSTSA